MVAAVVLWLPIASAIVSKCSACEAIATELEARVVEEAERGLRTLDIDMMVQYVIIVLHLISTLMLVTFSSGSNKSSRTTSWQKNTVSVIGTSSI
eukprot:SAG31_NODE_2705_length_5215_cov_9.452502_1_plen_95_part_00